MGFQENSADGFSQDYCHMKNKIQWPALSQPNNCTQEAGFGVITPNCLAGAALWTDGRGSRSTLRTENEDPARASPFHFYQLDYAECLARPSGVIR